MKQSWTTEEMIAEFEVYYFQSPYVVVRRRSTGKTGTLEFTHYPRLYFDWVEDPL